MTVLKYHQKSHVTLVTILVYFEKSYVVPPSCKVSQPVLNWFRIYNERPFTPPPAPPPPPPPPKLGRVKLGRVNVWYWLCNKTKILANLEVYFKSNEFTMTTVNCYSWGLSSLSGYFENNSEKNKTFLKRLVPTYDREMMTGFIRKEFGFSVGQNRVGNTLTTAFSLNHQERRERMFCEVNAVLIISVIRCILTRVRN